MKDIATHFTLILSGLRAAVAAFMARRDSVPGVVWLGTRAFVPVPVPQTTAPIPAETWTLAWTRLGRMAARFRALFDRWRAGTLPKPAPSRPGRPARPAAACLPTRHAWIVASVGYQAAGHASQLSVLLAEPEMDDFLAAVPQAGRILRPLCHMLGIAPLPSRLALAPKPRPPRRPRLRPAPPRCESAPKLRLSDLRRPRIPPPFLPFRKKPA